MISHTLKYPLSMGAMKGGHVIIFMSILFQRIPGLHTQTRTNVSKSHVLKVLASPEEQEQEEEEEKKQKTTTTTSDISSRTLIEPIARPVMDHRRS